MSIISEYASETARAALKRQHRAATISSVFISFLLVILLGLILSLILLPGFFFESPTIVTYHAAVEKEEEIDKPVMTPQVQRQPSAPSSSMAKVIASTTPSPTAVPVPEQLVPDPSVEFGDGDDFGDGWGSGSGGGRGGGGTTFFGQKSKADRIAYIIDFSLSMKGKREELMRKELQKSLDEIALGTQFQLVFFAGPAWVAGNSVKWSSKEATVKDGGKKSYKWKSVGGPYEWKPGGSRQRPEWMEATKTQVQSSKSAVRRQELVWGTSWKDPLEMVMGMDPPPQAIYFMTDGAAGGQGDRIARVVGAKAKSRGIVINCVAMMEPKAHDAMHELAKRTDGQFTIVHQGGKVEKVR